MSKGYLLLEDGTRFEGYSFGAPISKEGHVIFNTAMVGYPESLTDPSYMGQILVQTYPMVGNYGMPSHQQHADTALSLHLESEKMWLQGLIVADYSEEYNHWNAANSLQESLMSEGVPALTGVDTRALTKYIRNKGGVKAKLIVEEAKNPPIEENFENRNLVSEASCKEVITYGSGKKRILFVDCGAKHNIIRSLLVPEVTLIRVPWDYDFSSLAYDALFVSNGPGDPTKCTATVKHLSRAFQEDKPAFGICMGHQLFALAAGASIIQLVNGHHGHNQPVMDLDSERCYITSQNHRFCVDSSTLPPSWKTWFVNLNDHTNAGIRHLEKPFYSVQFHPECCGGPTDTLPLFDRFLELVFNR